MNTIWICIAIASLIIEIATPTALVIIWCFFGAIAALLLALFHVSVYVQVVVFVIVSILMMIVIRPLATKYLRGNTIATNADRLIGENAIITKEIKDNGWGEVRIQSQYWSAIEVDGKSIEVGKKVKVLAIEGAKLIVKER